MQGKARAKGAIRVGDYILLIDSGNPALAGAVFDGAGEIEASPEVAILQYSSGVMQVTDSFFEDRIYVDSSSHKHYFPNVLDFLLISRTKAWNEELTTRRTESPSQI